MLVQANAPGYLGQLFQTSRRPNTLLKLMGGIQGSVMTTTSPEFPIGVYYALRAPSQPANLEGAVAPAAQYRTVNQSTNVVQIFHEKVSLSYMAESNKVISGIVPIPQGSVNGPAVNPRDPEWQVMTALETIAQDANYSFLNGAYQNPADASTTALKTRGVLNAIVTNSLDRSADAGTTPTIYRSYINLLLQSVIQTTGFEVDQTWALLAGVQEFNNIAAAYEAQGTIYIEPEATAFGVKVRKILTRFGTVMLTLDPDMPAQYFAVLNVGIMGIVGLDVPGKGILFEEQLAKVGSSSDSQIYGQLGVAHGPEYFHGKLKVPAGLTF
jgi:hypothetical protein